MAQLRLAREKLETIDQGAIDRWAMYLDFWQTISTSYELYFSSFLLVNLCYVDS